MIDTLQGKDIASPPLFNVHTCATMDSNDAFPYIQQAAELMSAYNQQHTGALYERGTEEMVRLFTGGDAILLTQNGDVAYYGAIQPVFTQQETEFTGFQLVEFVNAIVHPNFRGQGIGTAANVARMQQALAKYGANTITYGTTINPVNMRAYERTNAAGNGTYHFQPVSFADFPYLAGLTCIYSAQGNDNTHICANIRRKPEESTEQHWHSFTQLERFSSLVMPCTLFVSDITKAQVYQENCRTLHGQLFGKAVYSNGELTEEDILSVGDFYTTMHTHAKH